MAEGWLDWPGAVAALRAGHLRPRADIADLFLGPATGTLMSRGAFIEGLGYGVKSFTVMDGNAARGLPSVQGAMLVFDAATGALSALVDSALVTAWKTAADSVLGARLLARSDSRHLLIVGAGTVAGNLARAYDAAFPGIERITIWARRPAPAEALAAALAGLNAEVAIARDLQTAVGQADIVSTATLARTPVLAGDWLRPGTHLDLIGAFKADMREADDTALARARIFADSRDTTLHHIGEFAIPLAQGVMSEADLLGDYYDLIAADAPGRRAPEEITLCKNGGGAHLDLMMADYIARALAEAPER